MERNEAQQGQAPSDPTRHWPWCNANTIRTSTAQDALIQKLKALARACATEECLRIELPPPSQHRIRTLVHRGAQRPVFKMTSLKSGNIVQCESLLEHELACQLDVSARVVAYFEQPFRIHYQDDGEWTHHVPDFAVLAEDRLTLIEVKFAKDVTDDVETRTRWMVRRLAPLGIHYTLLTEHTIRFGSRNQNAIRLLRRARHAACDIQTLTTLEQMRTHRRLPLSTFGWDEPAGSEAPHIARLIVQGQVVLCDDGLITAMTHVELGTDRIAEGEGAPW